MNQRHFISLRGYRAREAQVGSLPGSPSEDFFGGRSPRSSDGDRDAQSPGLLGRSLVVLGLALGSFTACELPRAPMAYAELEKERPPLPSYALAPDPELAASQAAKDKGVVKCGRFTGQREDGSCEALKLDSVPYGERLLLPRGVVLVGAVPEQYEVEIEQEAPTIRYPDQPLRSEIIDSFWLDVVEVQRRAYQGCVTQGVCTPARCPDGESEIPGMYRDKPDAWKDRLPQTCVSYQQAKTYCEHVDGRLPTLGEWTYGARGPENWRYSWGAEYRDDMRPEPVAVHENEDRSYYGLIGMGSGAMEMVAEPLNLDGALEPDLRRSFRSYKGPYRTALKEWERRYACKNIAASSCLKKARESRRLVMGVRIGKGRTMWDARAVDLSLDKGPDGKDLAVLPSARVGFRCAYDRKEDTVLLRTPAEIPVAPKELRGAGLRLYVGAAEAVSYDEAERFCAVLKVAEKDRQGTRYTRWRLPIWEDLEKISALRVGPGPIWLDKGGAAEGTASKEKTGVEGQELLKMSWTKIKVSKDKAMLARCVRDEEL